MRKAFTLALAAASAGTVAQGQLSASVSLFRPVASGYRSQTSDVGFGLALDYSFRKHYTFELGFARVGRSQHVDSISALVVGRYPLAADSSWYGLVGIGGYRHSARTGHDSLNKIGGLLGAGTKLDGRTSAELGYRISGSYLGESSDAIFVRLRFGF